MKERIFIQKAKEHTSLQEFVRSQFRNAKIGKIEVQHTPIMTRIIVHTTTPGIVIGAGGEKIRDMVEILKNEFGLKNPQIDVQRIDNADLEPNIIAQGIARSLESGVNHKKLGNFYLQRIMRAGAIGVEIIFDGKLAGERSRKERFIVGYLKKSGKPAEEDVVKGFAVALPKLGMIGVSVKIMIRHSDKFVVPSPVKKTEEEKIEKLERIEEEAKEIAEETLKEIPQEEELDKE
jgi:small subunit ribosomal protein S3